MTDEVAPKRRGRPPKREGERKAGNLTIRTYGPLRELLEAAAKVSGRSVSGEVEWRLENSFSSADLISRFFREFEFNSVGGQLNHHVGIAFARIIYGMQINSDNAGGDRNWTRDRVKALVEEQGASEMIPALLAHFPFPDDTDPHPDEVRREEAVEASRIAHERRGMQPKQG